MAHQSSMPGRKAAFCSAVASVNDCQIHSLMFIDFHNISFTIKSVMCA